MEKGPLNDRLLACFDHLSAQLQVAARFMVDHPRDVAMLSMREQARCAGLPPATMSRLAKRLGFKGYEGIRSLYQSALRDGRLGFSDKADAQTRQQKRMGDEGLLTEMLATLRGQIERLAAPQALTKISMAAKLLSSAETIYCLGLRASHAVAWQLHYILSLIGARSILLDGIAATGADPIAHATKDSLLLVVSIRPYTRLSVEIAQFAFAQGIPILAITDSALSPLARLAKITILVQTENPSFFHSLTSAFAVAEALGSLVAGHRGDDTLAALKQFDRQLAFFKTHYSKSSSRIKP